MGGMYSTEYFSSSIYAVQYTSSCINTQKAHCGGYDYDSTAVRRIDCLSKVIKGTLM